MEPLPVHGVLPHPPHAGTHLTAAQAETAREVATEVPHPMVHEQLDESGRLPLVHAGASKSAAEGGEWVKVQATNPHSLALMRGWQEGEGLRLMYPQ